MAHDGYIASFHGLQGIPWLAETIALSKQILMTEETGIHAHFSQITCRTSVELIRHAKQKGLPITCDVAMHQLHLTDDDIEGYNAHAYVLPLCVVTPTNKLLSRVSKMVRLTPSVLIMNHCQAVPNKPPLPNAKQGLVTLILLRHWGETGGRWRVKY